MLGYALVRLDAAFIDQANIWSLLAKCPTVCKMQSFSKMELVMSRVLYTPGRTVVAVARGEGEGRGPRQLHRPPEGVWDAPP